MAIPGMPALSMRPRRFGGSDTGGSLRSPPTRRS